MGDPVSVPEYLAKEAALLGSLLESDSSKAAGMGKTPRLVRLQPVPNQIPGVRWGGGGKVAFFLSALLGCFLVTYTEVRLGKDFISLGM